MHLHLRAKFEYRKPKLDFNEQECAVGEFSKFTDEEHISSRAPLAERGQLPLLHV